MCFSLATYLGCSPIVLIGGDHAFVGRHTHAIGMKDGSEMEYLQDERIRVKVPGYYGGEVETAEPFLSAMLSIADEARHHVVWNCTEGGANIPNCTNKPFSEVLFQEKGDIWWEIQKKLNKFVPGEKELLYANKARAIWGISKIINACNDGLNGKATLEDVCLADPPAFQILVMHIIQSFHVPFMMKPGDTGFWFLAVRDCCRRIKDELEQCTCDS
jgi:hypothetical protein